MWCTEHEQSNGSLYFHKLDETMNITNEEINTEELDYCSDSPNSKSDILSPESDDFVGCCLDLLYSVENTLLNVFNKQKNYECK